MQVETMNAIANTAIALAVAIIVGRQWITERARLRHELFDRRYEIYQRLTGFLADTLVSGRVAPGAETELLRDTKRAPFLFTGDPTIAALISDIYRDAVHLHALASEEKSLARDELKKNIQDQRAIKDRFEATLHSMEKRFRKYLELRD